MMRLVFRVLFFLFAVGTLANIQVDEIRRLLVSIRS
jgi:hypothetical protein